MLVYLFINIICSLTILVFLELRSRKIIRILEQVMSADKYQCIFSRRMKAIFIIEILIYHRWSKNVVSPPETHSTARREPLSCSYNSLISSVTYSLNTRRGTWNLFVNITILNNPGSLLDRRSLDDMSYPTKLVFFNLARVKCTFNIVKIKQQQPKNTDVHVTQNFKEIAFYALS